MADVVADAVSAGELPSRGRGGRGPGADRAAAVADGPAAAGAPLCAGAASCGHPAHGPARPGERVGCTANQGQRAPFGPRIEGNRPAPLLHCPCKRTVFASLHWTAFAGSGSLRGVCGRIRAAMGRLGKNS